MSEVTVNNVGDGNIAGVGVGPQGEPASPKTKIIKRKTYKEFVNARTRP